MRRLYGTNYNHMPANPPDHNVRPTGIMQWKSPTENRGTLGGDSNQVSTYIFDSGYVAPVAAKNQPRAWGSLACVYLGRPAS